MESHSFDAQCGRLRGFPIDTREVVLRWSDECYAHVGVESASVPANDLSPMADILLINSK